MCLFIDELLIRLLQLLAVFCPGTLKLPAPALAAAPVAPENGGRKAAEVLTEYWCMEGAG